MLSRYGYRFKEKENDIVGYYDVLNDIAERTALAEPLYWTRTGWILHTTAPSGGAGDEIRIWGSSANDNVLYTHAYAPWIKRNQLGASSIHARSIGFSRRCRERRGRA